MNLPFFIRNDIRNTGHEFGLLTASPVFFLLFVTFFPLAAGNDTALLQHLGAPILCLAALFSVFISLERLFLDDFKNGIIDMVSQSNTAMPVYIFSRITAQWVVTGFPLLVMSPFIGLAFGIGFENAPMMLGAIFALSWLCILIGAIGAILALGAKRNPVLLAIIVFPFYIPVLIFTSIAMDPQANGALSEQAIILLYAMLAAAMPICPVLGGKILNWQIRD